MSSTEALATRVPPQTKVLVDTLANSPASPYSSSSEAAADLIEMSLYGDE